MRKIGPVAFKFVVKVGNDLVRWEEGANHELTAEMLHSKIIEPRLAEKCDLQTDASQFCRFSQINANNSAVYLKLNAQVTLKDEGYVLTQKFAW